MPVPDTLVRYFCTSMGCASYNRPPSSSWGPTSEKRFAREPLLFAYNFQCRVVTPQPRYRCPNISLSPPRTSGLGAPI